MRELRDMNLDRGKVVEHRPDGLAIGPIVYGGVTNGDILVCFGWSHKGRNRTTSFSRGSWEHEVVENVIFLRRIAKDTGITDMPLPEVDLYTIVLFHKP